MDEELVNGLEGNLALRGVLCIWIETHGLSICCILPNCVVVGFVTSLHIVLLLVVFVAKDVGVVVCILDGDDLVLVHLHVVLLLDHASHLGRWLATRVNLEVTVRLLAKLDFLVPVLKVNVIDLVGVICIGILIDVLYHVLRNALGHSQRIYLFGCSVSYVRDEECTFHLLVV